MTNEPRLSTAAPESSATGSPDSAVHWARWSYPALLPLLLLPAAWLFAQPGSGWKAAALAMSFVCFAALLVWHLRRLYLTAATLGQRNLALEDALQLARDANGAQSDFIANVGHELRTPLTGILSLTHFAIESEPSPVVREKLDGIHASSQWMLRLLNELLDYSRMEAGKLTLESHPFVFRDLVFETLQPLELLARGNHIQFDVRIADAIPDRVRGDSLRIRQILVNLVGNAIKFTRRGSVTVTASVMSEAHPNVTIRLSVSDTGPGIPAEKQRRIFEPFVQSDASVSRLFGGTGLGLTIAADLARLMGGSITVESTPNEGSAFHCRLVLERDLSLTLVPPRDPVPPLRVLVAEDTAVGARFLERMLAKRGHSVNLAADGRQAWDLIRTRPFDMLLVDARMPEMDGLELISRIRAGDQPLRTLPVIVVTALSEETMRRSLLDAGANCVLTKPVAPADLDRALQWVEHGPRH